MDLLQKYALCVGIIHFLWVFWVLGIEPKTEEQKANLTDQKNDKFFCFFILLPVYLKVIFL